METLPQQPRPAHMASGGNSRMGPPHTMSPPTSVRHSLTTPPSNIPVQPPVSLHPWEAVALPGINVNITPGLVGAVLLKVA